MGDCPDTSLSHCHTAAAAAASYWRYCSTGSISLLLFVLLLDLIRNVELGMLLQPTHLCNTVDLNPLLSFLPIGHMLKSEQCERHKIHHTRTFTETS